MQRIRLVGKLVLRRIVGAAVLFLEEVVQQVVLGQLQVQSALRAVRFGVVGLVRHMIGKLVPVRPLEVLGERLFQRAVEIETRIAAEIDAAVFGRVEQRAFGHRLDRLARDLVIGEGQHLVADDLARLMALAGDAQHVARLQHADGRFDGVAPVADLQRLRGPVHHFGADLRRVFAARIVVGDDDDVGLPRRCLPHQRALARIAVAASTEHGDQPALGEGPQRRQRRVQRIGLVCVIDEDQRPVVGLADQLQPARRSLEIFQGRQRGAGRNAAADRQPRRDQRIGHLETAGQRQAHLEEALDGLDRQDLREPVVADVEQLQIVAALSDGEDAAAEFPRHRQNASGIGRGRFQHHRLVAFQQRIEQPHLGREIVLDIGMIVEVVAPQIGEGRGRQAQPVEPALVEPVA